MENTRLVGSEEAQGSVSLSFTLGVEFQKPCDPHVSAFTTEGGATAFYRKSHVDKLR